MRLRLEREYDSLLLRFFARYRGGKPSAGEIAYVKFGINGLAAEIEFPSDWHEQRRAWVRIGLGLVRIGFSFPWSQVVPDEDQCSGPTYGFVFFGDGLHLHYGKCRGTRGDPMKILPMPWQWRHREHKVLGEPVNYAYRYELRSGEVQERIAAVKVETRLWTRPWLPWRRLSKSIDVTFNGEVGERSGSWKGGCIGCGYEMKRGETAVQTLRRMERERTF